jgi:hypothetical protein
MGRRKENAAMARATDPDGKLRGRAASRPGDLARVALGIAAVGALAAVNAAPAAAAEESGQTAITVRADKHVGKMPYLFRNGNAINIKPLGYPLEKFFADQQPGSFYVASWNNDHYLKCRQSVHRLRQHRDHDLTGWNNNVDWMKRISDRGGEIILILGTSYWLGPKDAGLPPRDLGQWENFVRQTVNLFDNEMKLNVRYQVWDEPDTEFFRGTLDQYFETVRRAVIGMKKANPNARFGGPGSSIFSGAGFKAARTERPLVYNFIRYCSRTPLPEVGLQRIPLDYIGWHVFDAEPYTTLVKDQAAQTREWLGEFGYDRKTELNINSWTRLSGLSEEECNGPFMAAYALPMLCAMDEAGISRHVYFNLFDHWLPTAAQHPGREFFEGGYALFSRHFVVKPLYNAFRAMGMVEGQRLEVEEADPFVTCLAASDENRVSILLSNYPPRDLPRYLLDNAPALQPVKQHFSRVQRLQWTTGRPLQECAEEVLGGVADPALGKRLQMAMGLRQRLAGKTGEELASAFDDLRREATDGKIGDDLGSIAKLCREVQARREAPVNVRLKVRGLPAGPDLSCEHYIIDSTHSNAYAVRDRIQHIADRLCQAGDAGAVSRAVSDINGWPEVRLNCAERATVRVRAGGDLEKPLSVAPYSVHLIVCSRQERRPGDR